MKPNASWTTRALRLLPLALLPQILTACASTSTGATNSTADFRHLYCAATAAITYSSKDTAQTQSEIRAHNAAYDKICT